MAGELKLGLNTGYWAGGPPPGAVEAITGGAKAEQVAHAMGNTLSASNALFAIYVPVNVATLRDVMNARRAGRRKLR